MGISETLCMLRIGFCWPVRLFTYLPDDKDNDDVVIMIMMIVLFRENEECAV
jgi:hypothetical protein